MKVPCPGKLPKKPKIRGKHWTVEMVAYIPSKAKRLNTVGICDYNTKKIDLVRGLKWKEIFSNYIHETLHAMDDTLTEKQVKTLEVSIRDWLLDNL